MNEPIISFNQVSFQYYSQAAPTLKNISVAFYPGEKVLILGPSGSGKSTFARCLNGLIPNYYKGKLEGTLTLNGTPTQDLSLLDLSYQVGTVLQDTDGQFIGLTVAEDMAFALENDAIPQTVMHQTVSSWAEKMELKELLGQRPQDLSGGQKQRVSLAGVLVNETPILVFDEPLANLDPQAGIASIALIEEMHQATQATTFIIEHRLEDVLEEAVDRILVFDKGEIVADCTPAELLATDLLATIGIREPLYVTALKQAGVPLETVRNLENLKKLEVPNATAYFPESSSARQASPQIAVSAEHQLKPLLEVKNAQYRYAPEGPNRLQDVSFNVLPGERLSIVGHNGAGKSTLAKWLSGFVRGEGHLVVGGQENNDASIKERAEQIGYVLQNPNQMLSQKYLWDEVALGLRLRKLPEEEIQIRVRAALKTCGLYAYRKWPIAALSFGQKKRVTIAAVLVLDPKCLILDEPTAGQDYRHYAEMMTFFDEMTHRGKTLMMVTHDMQLMLEYTDRALVMEAGHLVADTTPLAVLTNPQTAENAGLKPTSLFTFAKKMGCASPQDFVEHFMQREREGR